MAPKTMKKKPAGAKRTTSRPKPRFIVNDKGERVEVVLPIELYERLLEEIEDREDTRIIEKRLKRARWVPWNEAKRQLHAV